MPLVGMDRERIEAILNNRLKPLLAVDGGDVEIVSIDEDANLLKLHFKGSYAGSPCREIIVKYVVEPILKQEIPDLRRLEWID